MSAGCWEDCLASLELQLTGAALIVSSRKCAWLRLLFGVSMTALARRDVALSLRQRRLHML